MAYIKTNWTAGKVLGATLMNNRETQYDEASNDINTHATGAGAHAASAISVYDAAGVLHLRDHISTHDPSFETCSGKIFGDPNKSNGQQVLELGGGWRAALHYAPVEDYIEVKTDGGRYGSKYIGIYQSVTGTGQWKATVGTTFAPTAGKWYRLSVNARCKNENGKVGAYLWYDSTDSRARVYVEQTLSQNEWTLIVRTIQVPTDYRAGGVVAPYLYGHFGGIGLTEWDGYMIEGPFDADPGTKLDHSQEKALKDLHLICK
jgi:hypothetical protein